MVQQTHTLNVIAQSVLKDTLSMPKAIYICILDHSVSTSSHSTRCAYSEQCLENQGFGQLTAIN
ncbi:hypothetical protein KIN20_022642 [Parelaphostrongylus tenuis]|uniref:Uncharacterized protein n=1 Tax=Parelaphostrongylus tenuis TaxID=148309 RepID=A0AAD5N6B9_PARTN|nr:hypothetical protein KIN20_022642 [Parelaphostrongylus tenuis]